MGISECHLVNCMLTDLVKSISLRQMLKSLYFDSEQKYEVYVMSDSTGMLLVRTYTDHKRVFLSHRGDRLNVEGYIPK